MLKVRRVSREGYDMEWLLEGTKAVDECGGVLLVGVGRLALHHGRDRKWDDERELFNE